VRSVSATRWPSLGRASRTPVHDLRVRVDAGLQRAGPDPGALRRLGVRLHAGRIHAALGRAAWGRAAGHAAGGVLRQPPGRRWRILLQLSLRGLDDRRLHGVRSGAGGPGAGRLEWATLAGQGQCVPAGPDKRRLLDRRHRLDDAPGHRGGVRPRRGPHGPVGRGAGARLWPGRAGGHGRQRPVTLADRIDRRGLCRRLRAGSAAVLPVRRAGGAHRVGRPVRCPCPCRRPRARRAAGHPFERNRHEPIRNL
jgi:hypothetical protein